MERKTEEEGGKKEGRDRERERKEGRKKRKDAKKSGPSHFYLMVSLTLDLWAHMLDFVIVFQT